MIAKKIAYSCKKDFLITNCRRLKKLSFFGGFISIRKDKFFNYRVVTIKIF